MKPLCIIGPTAIGKTAFSLKLAEKLSLEIISADSMQIYRHMDIGTAKPSPKERAIAPHHLIDILDPDENYSAFDFAKEAKRLIKKIQKANKTPLIVGGTGFYLNTLFSGLSFTKAPPNLKLRSKLDNFSSEDLHYRLHKLDPQTAEKIHLNNKKKLIRALEICISTKEKLSKQVKQSNQEEQFHIIGITSNRETIYENIETRVDKMFDLGLLSEIEGLLDRGYNEKLQSMQALGYKESIAYIKGHPDISSLKDLKELIKKRTRNFAKHQLTWFKRFKTVKWIRVENINEYIINSYYKY